MKFLRFIFQMFLMTIAGLAMAAAFPLRYQDWQWQPGWHGILIGSLGLLIYLGIATKPIKKLPRFILGFWGQFVNFSVVVSWVTIAMTEFGGIHWAISLLALFLLAAYCASFFGIWALVAGLPILRYRSTLSKILAWASLWAALEAFRQWFITGFGWGEIGYAFAEIPWIAKSAAITGVHGLTFLWIFSLAALVHLDQFWKTRNFAKRMALLYGLFASIIIAGNTYSPLKRSSDTQKMKIALVQPNINQDEKWNTHQAEDHLKVLLQMTDEAAQQGAELVVWPETAYPFLVSSNQHELPFKTKVPLLMGALVRDITVNRNSALMVHQDNVLGRFDKEHLVPFGEYVPLKEWLPFGKLVANVGDFAPGASDQNILSSPLNNLQIGPLICYEDIFSRSGVRLARKGAQLLANITNDAWYGKSGAQLQHANMAAFQVYQTGLPLVRSTNNGLTTVIERNSRKDFENFSRRIAIEEVEILRNPRQTFFVWTYPLMEWIWIFLFICVFFTKDSYRDRKIFFHH